MTTTATKERPILFSAPMVRALLAGTKTQTRRLVKPQPIERTDVDDPSGITRNGWWWTRPNGTGVHSQPTAEACMTLVARTPSWWCPYGEPGDRLWVRETVYRCEVAGQGIGNAFLVYADEWGPGELGAKEPKPKALRTWAVRKRNRWGACGAIHMPRWACRIELEITDVRVQRLQEITDADAAAEGVMSWAEIACSRDPADRRTPAGYFPLLWNSVNGAGAWDANPYVWALTFRRVAA